MLHRSTSVPVWSPLHWLPLRRASLRGPVATLLRYVAIAIVLTAIGCAYLWQVNVLSNLHDDTLRLERLTARQEQENVVLAAQLAQWNSPAYIAKRSAEEGYVFADAHIVQVAESAISSAHIDSGSSH